MQKSGSAAHGFIELDSIDPYCTISILIQYISIDLLMQTILHPLFLQTIWVKLYAITLAIPGETALVF